ncbi:autotransporter assembly complex family protein [Uliginosibacterium sp. sgz301328]|uniref:autotransporter assembly complex protein TamA n=1 Tax=Uliginosibacterium sp. sgz301328 TaxID=3243764 RepID=UPI00359F0E5F
MSATLRARAVLFVIVLSGLLAAPLAHARDLYILDAPDDVRPLLERFLPESTVEEDGGDDTGRLGLARRLRRMIPELLATEGYFSPTVDIDFRATPMTVKVIPGKRTEVQQVSIEFRGAITGAEFEARRQQLRTAWSLPVGRPFRQQDWNNAKNQLQEGTAATDFAAARIAESLADIDPETSEAHLSIVIDSGPAFTLGALEIEGLSDYTPELIERFNRIRVGDPYTLNALLSLQSALQSTPYFSAVEVDIDTTTGEHERVPVRVRLSEAKPRRAGFGVGYSSNTGYRAEVTYRDSNIFNRAWQLSSGVRIEQKEQQAFADVFFPPEPDGHRNSVGGLIDRSHIEGLRIDKKSVGVARTHPRGNIETRIGLSMQSETVHPDGGEESHTQALALNWSWTQRAVDNLLNPTSGYVLNVQFGGASKAVLSDANFVRSYGRLVTYWPILKTDVLQVRGEVGYTAAKNRQDVPEDFLFRTGGAQTVRGYSYLSLGVKDADATVGGRYMAVGSVEYTHWMKGNLGIAAFVDAGNAADELKGFDFKLGIGTGVRWRSPAGPLAVDLAYGYDDRRLRLHLSIAIAF